MLVCRWEEVEVDGWRKDLRGKRVVQNSWEERREGAES
jgi:hypothetical protein